VVFIHTLLSLQSEPRGFDDRVWPKLVALSERLWTAPRGNDRPRIIQTPDAMKTKGVLGCRMMISVHSLLLEELPKRHERTLAWLSALQPRSQEEQTKNTL